MSHRFAQITPTDHFGWHAAYLEAYEKLFAPFKDGETQLLEIGTDGGGGLRMYSDYFPHGVITGIDISPTPSELEKEIADSYEGKIRHIVRDAYSIYGVQHLKHFGPYHVIIDDGPHTLGSQEFFVHQYPNLLAGDGIAIVEDIQEWGHVAHLAKMVPTGFFAMGIDLRHVNGRYDDILLAIWRK